MTARASPLVALLAGCFDPNPQRGQACMAWCPPPESCVAGTCQLVATGDGPPAIRGNFMFVTSESKAPGALGGLTGGDDWCNHLAQQSGLPGHYTAWLSSSTQSAYQRLAATGARGWYRTDGSPFADTLDDIVKGKMFYPPSYADSGANISDIDPLQSELAATGTNADGSDATGFDCAGFTSTAGTVTTGYIDSGIAQWTAGGGSGMGGCSIEARIYCFGDTERDYPVTPTAPPGARRAFVTQAAHAITNAGRGALDSACAGDATAAGLSGTFVAWLGVTGSAASARLSSGTPWARLDGVVVLLADAKTMLAPLDLDIVGVYHDSSVWTGSQEPDYAPFNAASDCSDWTSPNTAVMGISGGTANGHQRAFDIAPGPPCSTPLPVYCVEQ
jgi:hypothetical protein